MRRLLVSAAVGAMLLALAACGDDDDEDVRPPDGAEVITIGPGASGDFADGDVTVTVEAIDDDVVTLAVDADGEEASIEGEAGAREEIGDYTFVVMDVDDDEVTIAVAETG